MAKRKEAEPIEERATEMISGAKLKSLLSGYQKASEDCAEINGAHGEEVKNAIEKYHLNRKAFNMTKGLLRLSPEALRETLDNFFHYLTISGLEKKAESAPRLPMEEPEEDNVHRLQTAE